MLSTDRALQLAYILMQGGLLAPEKVAPWLRTLSSMGLEATDPLCLTLLPSPKRALRWTWRTDEVSRFANWLAEVMAIYGLGGLRWEADGRNVRFFIEGDEVKIDWLYVNRERWFGGVSTMLNRRLLLRGLAMEVFDTAWVDAVVVLATQEMIAMLCEWFSVEG